MTCEWFIGLTSETLQAYETNNLTYEKCISALNLDKNKFKGILSTDLGCKQSLKFFKFDNDNIKYGYLSQCYQCQIKRLEINFSNIC